MRTIQFNFETCLGYYWLFENSRYSIIVQSYKNEAAFNYPEGSGQIVIQYKARMSEGVFEMPVSVTKLFHCEDQLRQILKGL